MSKITVDDVRTILRECAGVDEFAPGSGDLMDTSFGDLGYDSLALIEIAARLRQRFGVDVADEIVADDRTPRQLLEEANRLAKRQA